MIITSTISAVYWSNGKMKLQILVIKSYDDLNRFTVNFAVSGSSLWPKLSTPDSYSDDGELYSSA